MPILPIVVLAVIQGMAELLPVSSSAHVIVAEKLMGLDPSAPEMTFLLVMLHTGTMFAVILYFRRRWAEALRGAGALPLLRALVLATGVTGVLGLALKHLIEHFVLGGGSKAEIEALFSNLPLVSAALCAAGLLILWAGGREEGTEAVDDRRAALIGAVQGLCLPFRGFSRSGATISAGLLSGVPRAAAEDFSFALAVLLTPPVIAREAWRLHKAAGGFDAARHAFGAGLLGMVFSFAAGLLALRWLSDWLEKGRWRWFGWYCLAAAAVVLAVSRRG